jgi:hypothetical protein
MLRNDEAGDWIATFHGHKGAAWSCCLDKNALHTASASADFSPVGVFVLVAITARPQLMSSSSGTCHDSPELPIESVVRLLLI